MNEMADFFKSIIDNDDASVVICDTDHSVIYMNPAAIKNYAKRGGEKIVGRSILDCHNENSRRLIKEALEWFSASKEHNKIHTFFNEKQNKDVYMIALRDGDGNLIGYYEKHEFRSRDMSPLYDMPQ